MRDAHVDSIAHLLKEAKLKKQNKPIVFLGAGMSATGEIPLAGYIAKDILAEYGNNPNIKRLTEDEHTYYKLMSCLTTTERNQLLNGYIEKAKVNVAYIYLAHLIKQGYVDYVLTVNFDNLILRAMAMYNLFPPQYDLSILKNIPTSSIEKQSVTFLHGTYRGLRMLNTAEEMSSIKDICSKFFNRILEDRTWIVVGYSGDDTILDRIADLTTFTNNLYWVTYKDEEPNAKVKEKLLDRTNTNAYLLKGYDADSFFMRLHAELGEKTPDILQSPFSSILQTMESIVDVNDDDIYKNVKERLEINKRQIKYAIKEYEEGSTTRGYTKKKRDIDLLIKEVIKYTSEKSFDENASRIEEIGKEALIIRNEELDEKLSTLYNKWALEYYGIGNYKEAFDIISKASKPSYFTFAVIYEGLNDPINTIKYLDLSLDNNEIDLSYLKLDEWEELSSHPDFIALIEKYEAIVNKKREKK